MKSKMTELLKFKHLLFQGFFAILAICTLAAGFFLMGSPFEQKGIQEDSALANDLSSINYEIKQFYSENNRLPSNFAELDVTQDEYATKNIFSYGKAQYRIITPLTYQLCGLFQTDSKQPIRKNMNNPNTFSANFNIHKKGVYCITQNVIPAHAAPTPIPPRPSILPDYSSASQSGTSLKPTPIYRPI